MMEWQEYVALAYLIFLVILFLFLSIRSIVLNVRNGSGYPITKCKANKTNNNQPYDKPKPNGVFMGKIRKFNHCPNKNSATYDNENENVFSFQLKNIIKRLTTKCK